MKIEKLRNLGKLIKAYEVMNKNRFLSYFGVDPIYDVCEIWCNEHCLENCNTIFRSREEAEAMAEKMNGRLH